MNASAKHPSSGLAPLNIEVRHCETLAEYDECVKMELLTWGEHLTVPAAIFVVAHHTGGQILAAFDRGKMVGFTMALAGMRGGKTFLHSHMTAVLPDYQNRGVGRSLKLFQREDALKTGVPLVEWTFDPLELKNAHFNLTRLGAVVRRYIPNCYGLTESPLHAGLPTDRLVAEWWLDSDRVRGILADNPCPLGETTERISIPSNIGTLKSKDHAEGARIQKQAREAFQKHFHEGYVATGIESRDGATDYILEPAASIGGLRLPEYRPEEFED
jgi:predicted GNAT superfamily acetyltransferase